MCYKYYCNSELFKNYCVSMCYGSSNSSYNIIRNGKELLAPPQTGDNILGFGTVLYTGIFRYDEKNPIIFIK